MLVRKQLPVSEIVDVEHQRELQSDGRLQAERGEPLLDLGSPKADGDQTLEEAFLQQRQALRELASQTPDILAMLPLRVHLLLNSVEKLANFPRRDRLQNEVRHLQPDRLLGVFELVEAGQDDRLDVRILRRDEADQL